MGGTLDEAQLASHIEQLDRDGYTIVVDAFDLDLAAALHDDVRRLERELGAGPGTNGFEGHATTRVYNLLAHGPLYEQIPVHPTVLALMRHVLGDGCLISSLSSIAIGPGEIAQPIHADDQIMPLAKPHVATTANSMWAITDFTEANGATRIIPGTHTADHSPTYGQSYPSVSAEMSAGSILVWHGSLWHGGGANTTDMARVGIAMNYCAGWIRQQENQQLGIPLDVVRGFSPELQALCGFDVYRGLIGHIDKRSPAQRLLGADRDHQMVWSAPEMYRFVLRPKWLLFHLLVLTLVVLMVNLGIWQFHRLQDRRSFNDEVRTRTAMAVAEYDQVVTDQIATVDDADQIEWRPVHVEGRYLPDEQVTIINRSQGGTVGQNVVTPLQLAGGELVLVNRGFVAQTDPVPPPPTGPVSIIGRVRATEQRRFGGLTDSADGDLTELQRLDIERLAQQLPAPVAPVYIDLVASDPASGTDPIPLPDPELDEGPHLSYMIQWFIFSICAIVGWVLAVRRSARRRLSEATAPVPVDSSTPTVDEPTTAPH